MRYIKWRETILAKVGGCEIFTDDGKKFSNFSATLIVLLKVQSEPVQNGPGII